MNNNHFSPDAISHKDLNVLFSKAKKETLSIEAFGNDDIKEKKEFNNLLKDWEKSSQEILLMLNKQDEALTKNINPKSLMAFGAMSAHINMALQALKATEFNE